MLPRKLAWKMKSVADSALRATAGSRPVASTGPSAPSRLRRGASGQAPRSRISPRTSRTGGPRADSPSAMSDASPVQPRAQRCGALRYGVVSLLHGSGRSAACRLQHVSSHPATPCMKGHSPRMWDMPSPTYYDTT